MGRAAPRTHLASERHHYAPLQLYFSKTAVKHSDQESLGRQGGMDAESLPGAFIKPGFAKVLVGWALYKPM